MEAAGIPDTPGGRKGRPRLGKGPAVLRASPARRREAGSPAASPGPRVFSACHPGFLLCPWAAGVKSGECGEAPPPRRPPCCPWERCSGTVISPDSVGDEQRLLRARSRWDEGSAQRQGCCEDHFTCDSSFSLTLPLSFFHPSFLDCTRLSSDFLHVPLLPLWGISPFHPTPLLPRPAAAVPLSWSYLAWIVHGPLYACSEAHCRLGLPRWATSSKGRDLPLSAGVAPGQMGVQVGGTRQQWTSLTPTERALELLKDPQAPVPAISAPRGMPVSPLPGPPWSPLGSVPLLWALHR